MDRFKDLFEFNKRWAKEKTSTDENFFERLASFQSPELLWIGCSDSRVPPNLITGLGLGKIFVHRNIANIIPPDDLNTSSVIQYAIDSLRIENIVVCGHYCCGGIDAALGSDLTDPLDNWIQLIRNTADLHKDELDKLEDHEARSARLSELNIMEQVKNVANLDIVRAARERNQIVNIRGWIYDLNDGLLRDLGVDISDAAL
ncbi:MAG: carbonic anhydrase [Pseudomonadota bacterium]|nr:carbonic anhydrase [Pseudomonadota bacterium]